MSASGLSRPRWIIETPPLVTLGLPPPCGVLRSCVGFVPEAMSEGVWVSNELPTAYGFRRRGAGLRRSRGAHAQRSMSGAHPPAPPRESTESTGPSGLTTVIVLKASRLKGPRLRALRSRGMGESRKPNASTGSQ